MMRIAALAARIDFTCRRAYGAAAPEIVEALAADGLIERCGAAAWRNTEEARRLLAVLRGVP